LRSSLACRDTLLFVFQASRLGFHAELSSGNYDELERFGDNLLKNKGAIRMPFFSSDRYFQLVIDLGKKHIYTEPDLHPFDGRYARGWWSDLEPFDMSFDQIQKIEQNAAHAVLEQPPTSTSSQSTHTL